MNDGGIERFLEFVAILKSLVRTRPQLKTIYLQPIRAIRLLHDREKSARVLASSLWTRSGAEDSWIASSDGMTRTGASFHFFRVLLLRRDKTWPVMGHV